MVCFDGMSKVVGSLDGAMEMEKEDRKSQGVVIVVVL